MAVREPDADDLDRVEEVVQTAMRASYALSPDGIDRIVETAFAEDVLSEKLERDESFLYVAETEEDVDEPTVAGVVEATVDGDEGELNWLFVDTAHRGKGIGTELFETATEELRDAGADELYTTVLKDNTEGQQFVERFGFEHVDERELDVGDESFVKNVYVGPDVDADADVLSAENEDVDDAEDVEFPGTERHDGEVTATTEDGTRVYVDVDDERSGTIGRFLTAYADSDREEEFGFYCANCGSLETAMADMERIECPNCGNEHVSRSTQEYDDTHL